MPCSNPPPLTADQLSAAVDGEAEPGVMKHLAGCASCAARLAAAQAFERQVGHRLFRWDCPPADHLADFYLENLEPDEAPIIAAHIGGCASCRAELDDLRSFLKTEPAEAPASAPRPAARPDRRSLGEIIARLLPRAPALAMRGEAKGPLLAEAGAVVIVLDPQPADQDRFTLIGQLAAPEQDRWTGALVQLWQTGMLYQVDVLDEVGGFRFERLPAGSFDLRIVPRRGRSILVPELDLGD